MAVSHHLCFASLRVLNAIDADVNDGGARLDHVSCDEAGDACSCHHNVCRGQEDSQLVWWGVAVADGGGSVKTACCSWNTVMEWISNLYPNQYQL